VAEPLDTEKFSVTGEPGVDVVVDAENEVTVGGELEPPPLPPPDEPPPLGAEPPNAVPSPHVGIPNVDIC
jgi:hypothetical protein